MLFTNFLADMLEEGVYVLRNFNVIPNNGTNKATNHPFMIIFQRKIMVTRNDQDVLHTIGLAPLTASAICDLQYCDEFLLDMVGLLTGVSTEKEYVTMGVVHRFITLELTDHMWVEMALFDEYVDKFIKFLSSSVHVRSVFVVQLATSGCVGGVLFGMNPARLRVTPFCATTWLQTRIMFNPSIAKIALHGLENGGPLARLPGQVRYMSIKDDFLVINPIRKIVELEKTEQVMAIVDRASWWVLRCKCGVVLSVINGSFRCDVCNKRVFNHVPKYRLRVQVADGQDTTHFVLLDDEVRYLVRKSSDVLLDEVHLSMVRILVVIPSHKSSVALWER
ncbi:Nucleic acid-binding, OB-fold [Sesbania bispinosa]|nr:Nucleic acid-binding, OB-fold [Sesbania bispinosa]